MKNQSSPPVIIPLFQSVVEHFHLNNLELALSEIRSILANDPKNLYALALERRVKRILDLPQKSFAASHATRYSHTRIIAALEHICHMAVQQLTSPSAQASIHDMSRQLREQALENKHQALLHRARQQLHIQEYGRALQEAQRARIIRPQSAEADALILEIKAHMAAPAVKDKQREVLEISTNDGTGQPKQQRDLKTKAATVRPEAVTEKILSSISFADYHRTNADYAVCFRYIEQGLELDPSNEVLLQMKEEVEKIVMEKFSEKETSFRLA